MPITVTCPDCHRTFRVGDQFAGRRGLCPDCNGVVAIPDDEPDQLAPWRDNADDLDRPRPRRTPPRRPSPRDHLPAWRRVSVGFLVQQAACLLLLLGVVGVIVGRVALADDPADLDAEPNTAQMVAAGTGLLAMLLGFAVQAVGRLLAANTPVRGPRALGILTAVTSVLALLGACLVGGFFVVVAVEAEQGNAPDPAVEALGGLSMLGWMVVVVGGETLHGFALGGVGRVLRADGCRAMGNGLGLLVALAGLVGLFSFCGMALWVGNNPPQQPDPNHEQTTALIVWMIAVSAFVGLYLMLDLVLLQLGRGAIARIAADIEDEARPADRWD